LRLYYLDESGFSPSLATSWSWALTGQRKAIPYENPQGRRVNALAVWEPHAATPRLLWRLAARTLKSADLVALLTALVDDDLPVVVVMDNGSIHVSRDTQTALVGLGECGLSVFRLPAYSPELNDIERVFRTLKHHHMPERTYFTQEQLALAVDRGFAQLAQRLAQASGQKLCEAA
jgi:putative transposase